METRKLVTTVKGIYCRQCPEIITEHMMQTRGVIDAEVSFFPSELCLSYDPEIISETEIREKLTRIGYAPCEKGAAGSNPVLNAVLRPFRRK